MSRKKIIFKNRMTVHDFRTLISSLEECLKKSISVEIDISAVNYMSVFPYMLIEIYKDQYEKKGLSVEFSYSKKFIVSHFWPTPGQDQLSKFSRFEINKCYDSSETLKVTNSISRLLIDKMNTSETVSNVLSWIIGEIADNAGVHGYQCFNSERFPQPVYVGAFDNGTSVDICIADLGLGIVSTIDRYSGPHKRGKRRREYIKIALENGVSGHPRWSPGYGLYGSHQLISRGRGCMDIFSNGQYLKYKNNNFDVGDLKDEFNGTFICMRLDKGTAIDIAGILSEDAIDMVESGRLGIDPDGMPF